MKVRSPGLSLQLVLLQVAAAALVCSAATCRAGSITPDERDAPNRLRIVPRISSGARQTSSQPPETSTVAGSYLIYDAFTGADNTALVGRFAPTDTPAAAYKGNGNVSLLGGPTGGTPYEADIQSNAARLGGDAGLGVDLGTSAPMQLQLSLMFNINGDTETQTTNAHRGAGLGFFSSVNIASGGSSHGFNNFTGLVVDRTGSIRLILGGSDTGIFASVSGFDPTVNHTLTFNIDITSGIGSISNLVLDSASVALVAPPNTFTAARTVYAGFYNSSGLGTDLATFDNFSVASVPELSTQVALFIGALTMYLVRRFLVRLGP